MAVDQLPFQLICPACGHPLVGRDGSLLACPACTCVADVVPLANGACELVDFHPSETVELGCYEDHNEAFGYEGVAATGEPYDREYKSGPIRRLMDIEGKVVVDVGCRNCAILRHFAGRNTAIGVEISLRELFQHVPNALDSGAKVLLVCDGHRLPFPSNSVDVILCMDVLEHLLFPERMLSELRRVLRPGGQLLATVPNLVHLGNRLSIAAGSGIGLELAQLLKGRSPRIPVSGVRFPDQRIHLRFFTLRSLAGFLGEHGFEVVRRFGLGPMVSRLRLTGVFRNWALLAGVIARKTDADPAV